MTERQEFVHRWCNDVVEKLTTSVADVNSEKALTPSVTQQLLIEIRDMQKALDPEVYIPMYPRFLLDSWDGYDFVDDLLKLAYEYGRIRKGAKFRQGVPEKLAAKTPQICREIKLIEKKERAEKAKKLINEYDTKAAILLP